MELQYENITIRNAAVMDAGLLAQAGDPNGLGTAAGKAADQ